MWELDHKESWAPKNWCFWTVVLEKTLKSTLDSKEIKPVNPKGKQLWRLIGSTDAEVEVPIFWPPNRNSRLTGRDPDAGKDWRQKEKGAAEAEMVRYHHWLNGHELAQTEREWRTGKPGLLQSMGSQRVTHDLVAEQQWNIWYSRACLITLSDVCLTRGFPSFSECNPTPETSEASWSALRPLAASSALVCSFGSVTLVSWLA